MSPLPPVCILAGGLGTRLGDRVQGTPKPLIEVAGEPFLLHQLQLLASHGASRIVLCVGYLGPQIERRIGSERFGLEILYSQDSETLDGTLGAIFRAQDLLGERFLVLYGDTYLRVDYAGAARAWERSGLPAMMSVLLNEGRWDASNALFEGDRVVAYEKIEPSPEMRWIDYGLGGLTTKALSLAQAGQRDLAGLYGRLASAGELFGYEAHERFYEIGTPEGLAETESFLRGGARLGPSGGGDG
jgi:NDP-sugar pyrophosphorylase family protein